MNRYCYTCGDRLFAIWNSAKRPALLRFLLVGAVNIAATSVAAAWSSKDCPLFEPVHQIAIANALKDKFTSADILVLQQQQTVVDEDQRPNQSFEHAMTGVEEGQTEVVELPLYIAETETFIRDNLTAAIAGRRAGTPATALPPLGRALHPLEDATSPAHIGFQTWSYDESWWAMAVHVSKERVYPDDPSDRAQVAFKKALEGVVNYAYDIYMEKVPMPAQFFDSKGNLILPAMYTQ